MVEVRQNQLPVRVSLIGMDQGVLGGVVSASTVRAKVPSTPLAYRKSIIVRNESGQDAYLGGATVTSAGLYGFPFKNGEVLAIDIDDGVDLYVVLSAGTGNIFYLEAA